MTVASAAERLKAPTGAFRHRFASRSVLRDALWLRTVLDCRQGTGAALEAGGRVGAALHTPARVCKHPDEARLLLLHNQQGFLHGDWLEELREQVATLAERSKAGTVRFARLVFGANGPDEPRRARFLLAQAAVAALRKPSRAANGRRRWWTA